MADELRRSGRATKGQYTKDRDISEEKGSKRKGKGKGSKAKAETEANDDGEDEKIRCICGHYEEEEETERTMICCDNCEAWQHNDCMGLPDDYAPPQYFCEECKPEDHKELLAAVARGEKPWEEVARKRDAAAAEVEQTLKKKGGKKGRKSGAGARASDVKPRDSQEAEGPQTLGPGKGANGQKRKLEEPSNGSGIQQDTKKARQTPTHQDAQSDTKNGVRPAQNRKSSAMTTPSRQASRSELAMGMVVSSVEELSDNQRKSVATHLVKLFIDQTNVALKAGAYSLPNGRTAKEIGAELGLRVEHAMYHVLSGGSGDPSDAYKHQLRTVIFNVKKNPLLRDRLLSGNLSAHGFAAMDAKDMASEELQQKDAAIKKEAEKQYTVIQEQGPRIRRTHKGDEYVDEAMGVASESTLSQSTARRPSLIEHEPSQTRSPDTISPALPHAPGEISLPKTSQGRPRPSIDTARKSSTNFNIQDVWSSVQGSPDGERQQFGQLPQHQAEQRLPGPGTQADADIDELLKDENEDAESPPYSPKDSSSNNEIVWRGVVNGGTIGRFQASARYAAGANISDLSLSWSQLIPSEISIEGRIDPAKADEYLCGLQYSASSDVVIVSISEPEDPTDHQNFTKLFDYFKKRKRYGVGIQHSNQAIKDIYLVPLEAGSELPELLQLLEQHELKGPISERLLLIPFVVKSTDMASATPRDQMSMASPLIPAPAGSVLPTQPFQHSPVMQDGSVSAPYGQPPPPMQAHSPTDGPHLPTSPSGQQQSKAALAAMQVLGPMSNAPAVLDLIQQVPNAGVIEMNVVREIINENAQAANDLVVLTRMLQEKNLAQQ